MRRISQALLFGLLVIGGLTGWWFIHLARHGAGSPQHKRSEITTGAPPPQNAFVQPITSSALSKQNRMAELLSSENHQPITFFGKVVDQDGQPVPDVTVYAQVMVAKTWMSGHPENFQTTTDGAGFFSFENIKGSDIAFGFEKPGYEYRTDRNKTSVFKYSLLVPEKERHHADRSNPVVFTMWKAAGAEPLIRVALDRAHVAVDGSPLALDLLSGKIVQNGGDLTVSVQREPEHIERGKRFDWHATVAVTDGGLAEVRELYPNEAPVDGYTPQWSIDMPAVASDWHSSLTRNFYVKLRGGKTYGRVQVEITADYEPPPTGLTVEAFVNPSGSRNLEFDPKKVIRR